MPVLPPKATDAPPSAPPPCLPAPCGSKDRPRQASASVAFRKIRARRRLPRLVPPARHFGLVRQLAQLSSHTQGKERYL